MLEHELSARQTLAVLMGASSIPRAPKLAQGRAFYLSAWDFQEYLLDETGLNLARNNILWLFDDSRSSSDQMRDLGDFLKSRSDYLKNSGTPPQDLIVYYVGHGLFSRSDHAYCFAIRATDEGSEGVTSIRVSDFASIVRDHARFLRKYLILDCCFSSAAYKEFQSGPLQVGRTKLLEQLPQRGTTLLCSASAQDASLAPGGLSHTMFSDSLLSALRQGHPSLGPRLSLSELGDLVKMNLAKTFPDTWVRPEVHSPDQRDGDVANVGVFPNAASVAKQAAVGRLKAEAEKTRAETEAQEQTEAMRLAEEERRQAEAERTRAETEAQEQAEAMRRAKEERRQAEEQLPRMTAERRPHGADATRSSAARGISIHSWNWGSMLRTTRAAAAVIFLGGIGLTVPPQARDMFAFPENYRTWPVISFQLTLVVFAASAWFWSRAALAARFGIDDRQRSRTATSGFDWTAFTWLPRLLLAGSFLLGAVIAFMSRSSWTIAGAIVLGALGIVLSIIRVRGRGVDLAPAPRTGFRAWLRGGARARLRALLHRAPYGAIPALTLLALGSIPIGFGVVEAFTPALRQPNYLAKVFPGPAVALLLLGLMIGPLVMVTFIFDGLTFQTRIGSLRLGLRRPPVLSLILLGTAAVILTALSG
jgi:hypothetical protein